MGISHNAHSFMHANHFTFHPIAEVLLHGIIVDQLNLSSLKLHAKQESGLCMIASFSKEFCAFPNLTLYFFVLFFTPKYLKPCFLDDQTQVDLKPAGQPEQASVNLCQLIAQNWCSVHAQLMLAIQFLCNLIDTRALIGPCSHVSLR